MTSNRFRRGVPGHLLLRISPPALKTQVLPGWQMEGNAEGQQVRISSSWEAKPQSCTLFLGRPGVRGETSVK